MICLLFLSFLCLSSCACCLVSFLCHCRCCRICCCCCCVVFCRVPDPQILTPIRVHASQLVLMFIRHATFLTKYLIRDAWQNWSDKNILIARNSHRHINSCILRLWLFCVGVCTRECMCAQVCMYIYIQYVCVYIYIYMCECASKCTCVQKNKAMQWPPIFGNVWKTRHLYGSLTLFYFKSQRFSHVCLVWWDEVPHPPNPQSTL